MNQEQIQLLINGLSTKIGNLEVENMTLQVMIEALVKENEQMKKQLESEMEGEMK